MTFLGERDVTSVDFGAGGCGVKSSVPLRWLTRLLRVRTVKPELFFCLSTSELESIFLIVVVCDDSSVGVGALNLKGSYQRELLDSVSAGVEYSYNEVKAEK